jgi:hypothetical protein
MGSAILWSLATAAPAPAQTLLTPEGPATLRGQWLGPNTAEGRPPEVIVRWSVTVADGGRPGYVRLRVLRPGDQATLVGSSPRVWLPAEPGVYGFGLRPGIRYDYRDSGLAIAQETGGHAIVSTFPSQPEAAHNDPFTLHALDIFRPPVPDGAVNVEPSERVYGRGLRVSQSSERDTDEDGLGDVSQDLGDLRILSTRITSAGTVAVRRARELVVRRRIVLHARIRNVGATTRQLPHIVPPKEDGWGCVPPAITSFAARFCAAPPLRPGRETFARLLIYTPPQGIPARLTVAAEGPDLRPKDNSMRLTCPDPCRPPPDRR